MTLFKDIIEEKFSVVYTSLGLSCRQEESIYCRITDTSA